MTVRNHIQRCPRLLGGVEFGVQGGQCATLGVLLTSDGIDRWALSTAHAIRSDAVVDVLQPLISSPGVRIGDTGAQRTAPGNLDCAAIRLDPQIPFLDEILGIGSLAPPSAPQVGRRVIKAGAATGLTQGRIERVQGDSVRIEMPPHYPPGCRLTDRADSGAVWVDVLTRAPVALHFQGNQAGVESSNAIAFPAVCAALNLDVPQPQ